MGIVDNLKWRYATKKYDNSKKVSAENIEKIKDAIRLAPSSYGFQPYKVLVIEDQETRKKLQEAAYGQSQIVDASHLFVFAAHTKTDADDVDALMNLIADTRNVAVENLKGYADYIKGAIGWMTPEQQTAWNTKQVYIGLANLLVASAELHIDSTPMEGFQAAEFDRILGLKDKGLTAAVVAAVGYRSPEDATANYAKARKPKEELFEVV